MKIYSRLVLAAGTAVAAMAVSSCNGGGNFSGTLSGIESDSLIVTAYRYSERTPAFQDTIALKNDKFSANIEDTSALIMFIAPMPKTGAESVQAAPMMKEMLVLVPGDKIKVSGSIEKPEFKSHMIYNDLSAFTGRTAIMDRIDGIYAKAATLQQNDTEGMEALNEEHEAILAEKDSIYADYIAKNPDKMASGYLALHMESGQKGLDACNALGEKVKSGALGEIISITAKNYERQATIEKNKENIQPGKPAPDFSLKDLKGNTRTLASFKGKYVLLDFWGKWCYWCMKGMPDMKEYYAKYSKKIEFVGINCRDSEETWRETVEKEGLKWTNLYNGDGTEIVDAYAIEGYPTKILIDAEGKIVEVFVGESEELYNKLDELF